LEVLEMSEEELERRYHFYSIQLFAEAMTYMSKVVIDPQSMPARGEVINTLRTLISALQRHPHEVITAREEALARRAKELLTVADESVNGSDTTEGRAKLYTLVEELKKL